MALKQLNQPELTRLLLESNKLPREVPFTVYFSDMKNVRTLAQNRYLWGVVYDTLSAALGYDPEEIHEICKAKFGLRTKYEGDIAMRLMEDGIWEAGDSIPVIEFVRSTRLFDTREMTEYIEKIRRWSLDKFGLYIKQPGELDDGDYIRAMELNP